MYKKASQNQQYLTRSGSQGTRVLRKPFLTDLNTDVLDVSYTADMEAQSYANTLEERDALMQQRAKLQEKLNHINLIKREYRLDEASLKKLEQQRRCIGGHYRKVCDRLEELKRELKGSAKTEPGWYEEAFVEVAKRSLPRDVFESLHEAATILYRQKKKERLSEQPDTSA
jgi:predicted nuclease with TOPRIM domain